MQAAWEAFAQDAIAIKKQDTTLRGQERQIRRDKPEEIAVDVWMATGRKDLLHTSIDELLRILKPHLSARTALALASDEWENYCTSVRNHPVVFHRWFEAHEPDRLMPPGTFTQTAFANANLRNLLDNQFYLVAEAEVPFPRMLVRMRDCLTIRLRSLNKRPRESDAKHAALEAHEESAKTLLRLTHTAMYSQRLHAYFQNAGAERRRAAEEDASLRAETASEFGLDKQKESIAVLRRDIQTSATVTSQRSQRDLQQSLWRGVRNATSKILEGNYNWELHPPAAAGLGPRMVPDDEDPLLPLSRVVPKARAPPAEVPGPAAESKEEKEKALADRLLSVSIVEASEWVEKQRDGLEMATPPEEDLKRMLRAEFVDSGWKMFLATAESNQKRCLETKAMCKNGPLIRQMDLLMEEYGYDLVQARHSVSELGHHAKEKKFLHYLLQVDVVETISRLLDSTKKILADNRIKEGMKVARLHLQKEMPTDQWPMGSRLLAYFTRRDALLRALDLERTPVVLVDEIQLTFDNRLKEYEGFFQTNSFVEAYTTATSARDTISQEAPPGAPSVENLYLDWTVDQARWLAYRPVMRTEYDKILASLGVSDHRLLPGIVLKPATELLVETRESRSVTFRQVLNARVGLERAHLLRL